MVKSLIVVIYRGPMSGLRVGTAAGYRFEYGRPSANPRSCRSGGPQGRGRHGDPRSRQPGGPAGRNGRKPQTGSCPSEGPGGSSRRTPPARATTGTTSPPRVYSITSIHAPSPSALPSQALSGAAPICPGISAVQWQSICRGSSGRSPAWPATGGSTGTRMLDTDCRCPYFDCMSREDVIRAQFDLAGLGLEVGPSYNPLFPKSAGYTVETIDYTDQPGLQAKSADNPTVDCSRIEPVDYVSGGRPMREVIGKPGRFEWIFPSNVIDHIPDLIGVINDCAC